jgi:hypothetical protein
MAMAVDENLAEGRFKCTVQTALMNLQREELIDHHYVLFHTPAELFIINQIGQVVGQSRPAGRLADHYFETLLNICIQIAKRFLALRLGLS